MPIVDVTDQVDFGWPDDECLPMKKCGCGATWALWEWDGLLLSIYKDDPRECPECGRKFYWESHIKVFEVT